MITAYFQNSRGIRSKTQEFKRGLFMNNYDILGFCETWLLDTIYDAELSDSRYEVFRRDRTVVGSLQARGAGGGGRARAVGGGVMLLSRRQLAARRLPEPPGFPYECIHIVIPATTIRSINSLHVICAYLPGSGFAHELLLTHFINYLKNCLETYINHDFLILGDFNMPSVLWYRDPDAISFYPSGNMNDIQYDFCTLLSSFGLNQFNGIPNDNGRFLDLIISNLDIVVKRCDQPLTREDLPHHPALMFDVLNICLRPLREPPTRKFNFRKANYDRIRKFLSDIDWSYEIANKTVNDAVQYFYDQLNEAINIYVPCFVCKPRSYPVWFSKSLINIIKEKHKFHKRWKKFHNPIDYESFTLLRKRQKMVQSADWHNYISKCEDAIASNPKYFWNYTRNMCKNTGVPLHVTNNNVEASGGTDICNAFLDYFKSVYVNQQSLLTDDLTAPTNFINTIHSIELSQDLVYKYILKINVNN